MALFRGSPSSAGRSRSSLFPGSPDPASEPRSSAPVQFKPRNDLRNPVHCECNKLAEGWTSWTERNPGRIFFRCEDYLQGRGCGFYKWEQDQTPNQKALMLLLKNRIEELENKVYGPNPSFQGANNMIATQQGMITSLTLENARLLEEKNNALAMLQQEREITKAMLLEQKEGAEKKLKMLQEEDTLAAGLNKFHL
ncbi:hypothetical protein ACP70R_028258 [Stipagrostis hirtigluma subsp. patula]